MRAIVLPIKIKSSLVFKKGFTKAFIDGVTKNSTLIIDDILSDIYQIGENKKLVIVDGVGGVSTGSVIGASNVDIALALEAPVIFVGGSGIGSAIDDTVLAISFMQQRGVKDLGLVYNKIRLGELDNIKYYLKKRLTELLPNIPILDFIAEHRQLDEQAKQQSAEKICQWFNIFAKKVGCHE